MIMCVTVISPFFCMYKLVHVCSYTSMKKCVYVCVYMQKCCLYMCLCVYMYMWEHVCICAYYNTYTYLKRCFPE